MSRYLILNEEGLAVEEGSFRNQAESIAKHFGKRGRARVAMEVGTQTCYHSSFRQVGTRGDRGECAGAEVDHLQR